MDENRWRDEAFLADAAAWIDDRLADVGRVRSGELEQVHVRPWATAIRVPTTGGPAWFKANEEALRHEAAVVELLSARRPDDVPPLIASDRDSGWMLMADAGEMLRTVVPREGSLERWRDVLARCAAVQLACEGAVDELLAAGAPDLRLDRLPERYEELVDLLDAEPRFRAAGARVRELADRLAAHGIAATVSHDDLHDGQVFVHGDDHRLMDWGDACVTHPFLVLSVALEGVVAWGLDDEPDSEDLTPYLEAYLAPYAAAYPHLSDDALHDAARDALRLGWACRAVNGHVAGDDAATLTRLRMFLDGRP